METRLLYDYYLECSSLFTDSRRVAEGGIFFALKGASFDGNRYATQALAAGARYAVIDDPAYDDHSGRMIVVEDTLQALQALARHHRRQYDIPIIAITGTNGKTTTKELTNAVMSTTHPTLCTEGNFNNHLGVPLTLLRLLPSHTHAIIEMGANHCGEIAELCAIAEPTHGLITNVGQAHLEGFGSFEGIIRTKTELYRWLRDHGGTAFVDRHNDYLTPHLEGLSLTTYGVEQAADEWISDIACSPMLHFRWQGEEATTITTKLIGSYNAQNCAAAIAVGSFFGVERAKIASAIADYSPTNNRSQWFETKHNRLIIDAYNANPSSMAAALDNLARIEAPHRGVILGDMFELGDNEASEHQRIVALLEGYRFDTVILCGAAFASLPHNPFTTLATTEEACAYLAAHPITGATLLLKGSRGMGMERLIDSSL